MRFMIIMPADEKSEAGILPDERAFSAMGKYNEELMKAGVMLAGEGLHPTSKGARVRFSKGKRTVIEGPFPEAKELVAGFWLWQVKSKEEAIEWVKRIPNPNEPEGDIEIRQVYETEDFGSNLPDDVRESEERMRAQLAGRGKAKVEPYLNFDGRCAEALEFYKRALGAEVTMLMRFKDAPDQSMVPPGSANNVMHSSFRVGETTIMASDGRGGGKPSFQGIALSITAPSDAEAERLFAALADGGQVTQALTTTFFSSRFGMVTDRFGVGWMLVVAPS